LKNSNAEEVDAILSDIKYWKFGKINIFCWIDILDMFDGYLEKSVTKVSENNWQMICDSSETPIMQSLTIGILNFLNLLMEHSITRIVFNSIDHIITLLNSSSQIVVYHALNLIFLLARRSSYFAKTSEDVVNRMNSLVSIIAYPLGKTDSGVDYLKCCRQDFNQDVYSIFPSTLNLKISVKNGKSVTASLNLEKKLNRNESLESIMDKIILKYQPEENECSKIFLWLRFYYYFKSFESRLLSFALCFLATSIHNKIVPIESYAIKNCDSTISYIFKKKEKIYEVFFLIVF
ncbi:MAG: E3 ubiquitin-protein ligase huwe1, partial [Paramarteilia canceri]